MTLSPGTYGILEENGTLRSIVIILVETPCKDGRAKPVVMTAQPGFNPATQKVIQNGWTVNTSDVTPNWEVVALSQDELDEIADRDELTLIRATVTDMVAGNGTAVQRTARCERALAWLLKRLVKNMTIP